MANRSGGENINIWVVGEFYSQNNTKGDYTPSGRVFLL